MLLYVHRNRRLIRDGKTVITAGGLILMMMMMMMMMWSVMSSDLGLTFSGQTVTSACA